MGDGLIETIDLVIAIVHVGDDVEHVVWRTIRAMSGLVQPLVGFCRRIELLIGIVDRHGKL